MAETGPAAPKPTPSKSQEEAAEKQQQSQQQQNPSPSGTQQMKRFVPIAFKTGGYGVLDTHTKRLVNFRKASPEPQQKAMATPPEAPEEKHSLSVLKYMHEVSSALLKEGEEIRSKLDHPGVDKLMEKWLQHQASWLEDIEGAADKFHPDNGGMIPPEEIPAEPPPNTPGIGEVSPDEAVEGMKLANSGPCSSCGQTPCTCGSKSLEVEEKAKRRPADEGYGRSEEPSEWEAGYDAEEAENRRDARLGRNMRRARQKLDEEGGSLVDRSSWSGEEKGLHPKEIQDSINESEIWNLCHCGKMEEAKKFLAELAKDGSSLTDEMRFMAYHLHKAMEDEGMGPDVMDGDADEKGEKSLTPDTKEMTQDKAREIIKDGKLHGKPISELPEKQRKYIYWRAAQKSMDEIVGATLFLKSLAFEKAFGDPHRNFAKQYTEVLEKFLADAEKGRLERAGAAAGRWVERTGEAIGRAGAAVGSIIAPAVVGGALGLGAGGAAVGTGISSSENTTRQLVGPAAVGAAFGAGTVVGRRRKEEGREKPGKVGEKPDVPESWELTSKEPSKTLPYEPGEMGEKELNELASTIREQQKAMEALTAQMTGFFTQS